MPRTIITAHFPKNKILTIDDEKNMRRFYKFILRDFYDVRTARNNETAMDLLQKSQFQLIISDMARPGGGGIELLQHLIDHPALLPRKILFCSGWLWGSLEDVQRVLRHHSDLLVGMMSKPFEMYQLRRNIIKMLNGIPPFDIEPPTLTYLIPE
jgi:DNA-binding NtrC family response regulator